MVSTKEAFGLRVRRLREGKGLSQERFADAIQVGRGHMGKIENGKTNPSLEIIARIAEGLDISLAELFETLDHQHAGTGPASPR